jgi:lipoprotein-releasing system ATP-binding protein
MGLADKAAKKPNSLSGGEQQRIAVARALINDPHLIFADEPTGNLDSENAIALHELFIQLRDTMHQSFLIVTHNESLADRCNRKLTMKDGIIL